MNSAILVSGLLVLIIISAIIFISRNMVTKDHYSLSIKESMDLCELPVVTFINNGNKYNFLLDTGSTVNHICSDSIATMISKDTDSKICNHGFSGEAGISSGKVVDLEFRDLVFSTELFVSDCLKDTFDKIKKLTGVTVHGLLGSSFFAKYKYVIDYYNLKAYPAVK